MKIWHNEVLYINILSYSTLIFVRLYLVLTWMEGGKGFATKNLVILTARSYDEVSLWKPIFVIYQLITITQSWIKDTKQCKQPNDHDCMIIPNLFELKLVKNIYLK